MKKTTYMKNDMFNDILQSLRTHTIEVKPLPEYSGNQIKSIRESQYLSQVVFASVLGVSPKTVEAWEAGRNIPIGPAQRLLSLMYEHKDFLVRSNL